MKYFEFNKTDYYALIAADYLLKSMKIYVDVVAYDSVDELRVNNLHPIEISRDQALLKFLLASGNEDDRVSILKNEFDKCENSVLLIDGSLI